MVSYDWDREFERVYTILREHNIMSHSIAFSAVRSCIEADMPTLLAELLGNNRDAHIYALMVSFTSIPATKCIEYLISQGTPLNESFAYNPFKCTPQELLDSTFTTTKKEFSKTRTQIYKAIKNGSILEKKNDHKIVFIDTKQNTSHSHEKFAVDEKTQEKEEKPFVFKLANAVSSSFRFILNK